MSLSTTIGVGLLIGGAAALAVYASVAPLEEVAVALPAVPTLAPVPTPTVTVMAADCEAPAVLTDGECVLTTSGPVIQASAPVPGPPTSAAAWGDDDDSDDATEDDHHDDDDDHHRATDDDD